MADFDSKYSGEQVEALLDQVASGNTGGGGGGGIAVETDPIFSASPAATITEADKSAWGGKQDAISDLATIREGASKGATSVQPDDIEDFVKSSELADVAYTADYNELENKPTFKTINGESVVGSGDIAIAGGSGEVGPQGPQGDKGDTGVGVQSVKQTTTSNVDSGYNVVTVTLTDGTTSTFSVKNGSKGSNGTNGKDGADGDDGATFTPSVDSAGNLSWSNNKGLANPPTVNIKGPKGDAGEGGGSTGGGTNMEVIISTEPTLYFAQNDIPIPNKIYVFTEDLFNGYIGGFATASNYDTYTFIFKFPESGLTLPYDVKFPNGVMPTIEYGTLCELSIVGISMGNTRVYNAVLTPFKAL